MSLLKAKAASRNDRPPITYLAARLRIAEADVPRPSTPAVGLKSLSYFDRTASKDDKPILVGEWPCAVFGTSAADGRTHAHRIYFNGASETRCDETGRPGPKSTMSRREPVRPSPTR